jgi:hypothetical protein
MYSHGSGHQNARAKDYGYHLRDRFLVAAESLGHRGDIEHRGEYCCSPNLMSGDDPIQMRKWIHETGSDP